MVVGITELVVVASAIGPAVVKTVVVIASEAVLPYVVDGVADVERSVITVVVGGTEVLVD